MRPRKQTTSVSPASFIGEFTEITGLRPSFDDEYLDQLGRLVDYLRNEAIRPLPERRREFLAHVNSKFRLNAAPISRFFGAAAAHGITFHFHHKNRIQRAFDLQSRVALEEVLAHRGVSASLRERLVRLFEPVSDKTTISSLSSECEAPSKLRIEKGNRDIFGEILKAQFSAFMWVSLPEIAMHRYFDPHFDASEYRESFWDQLHLRSPKLFSRRHALSIARISQPVIDAISSSDHLRGAIADHLSMAYDAIDNYGFLVLLVDSVTIANRSVEWEIAADATLFAEKHRYERLEKAYFRWEEIRDATKRHIPNVPEGARFDLANEGFTYRDCFVLQSAAGDTRQLMLIFQKNQRDETPIPCPACRSNDVQGNSYPSLGVRSWECNNPLCPDRSKYNRGKRYSFRGLVMQQAIEGDGNEIPPGCVRRWMRDVVGNAEPREVVEMLCRHYSMHGDTIHVYNWPDFDATSFGRETLHHELRLTPQKHAFWDGPLFQRYALPRQVAPREAKNLGDDRFRVLLGDSAEVLRTIPDEYFDGAVTSPPYYNAREYSQWPNIYCYLQDMYDINREVFRTLKPGAVYLYNIFDYFDNENTVALSAMGQKRMILSAYTVDLFRRIGFQLLGNTVWDKGDIEGKRGFNAGNYSPYYQSPFNCWEHVLIFGRPSTPSALDTTPPAPAFRDLQRKIARVKPVIKMVRGENTHGHTAPYPDEIPELLVTRLKPDAVILDPFGGSLTSGRAAERHGLRSVCIERSAEYCQLGLQLRSRQPRSTQRTRDLTLFDA